MRARLLLFAALLVFLAQAARAAESPAVNRPRVALVLSGGGARGLAHVGVLKVLEELRVPVDAVAGTSMGAIVGGLYASGLNASALEREVLAIPWDSVFASRVERPLLAQRRKEEDFEIATAIELGLRDGELRTPSSAVSSRGLESLLRRFTLPVRHVARFDDLPIPFRAVATDMESGAAVVLASGDLALALRSSMSVPGVFAPTEWEDRVLGDGGLVNNLPVDVGRALVGRPGRDTLVIAVNVGTPVGGRDTLGSVVGLTAQMINILTEQNVQRSLAQLGPQDLLLRPALGSLTSGDFGKARDFIAAGEAAARALAPQLAALALPPAEYAAWRATKAPQPMVEPQLGFVRIEGTATSNPERLAAMLESQPGQTFDAARAERDARKLAAGGDYTRTDYRLSREAGAEGLVFELEDKPWGPNYLRLGLDLSTDFSGRSAFNLKLSHNRHWLTPAGTEWRNRVQIGEVPLLYSELYHPLRWSPSLADDWFASAYLGAERRRLWQFGANAGDEIAEWKRSVFSMGVDIGQPWGDFGELRLGLSHVGIRTSPQLLSAAYSGPTDLQRWSEDGIRARVVVDQLDFANFPLRGHRFEGQLFVGQRRGDVDGSFQRVELQGTLARSWGAHTLNLHARAAIADLGTTARLGRYTLGGFHQLSGYQMGQLEGDDLLLLRLGWYRRLSLTPTLTRGFFVGGTLEAGNVWARRRQMRLGDLRSGASLYLGADTGIGPLYLGLTFAPGGQAGLALFIGRP
ncbi:putative esterase of the alpha-beta hydrolase superfamily [Burkholderiales bacterium JOSHI_001]|nr:putative esterase of the alpha-beta hydrolase superfamily [Burkholderiales bacterium JOSHI_001]